MSLQMQSSATNVARKGSLSLGNSNNNSSAKTKQQKLIDCIDMSDEQPKKTNNGKDKKFTNGSSNSNNSKTNDKNAKKTEEKAVTDKEKTAVNVKKTPSEEKVNQEKKKAAPSVDEKGKPKEVKKASSSEGSARKDEKPPKPSTPTLTGKKVAKAESSTNKEEKQKETPTENPKVDEEKKAKEEPTTTTDKEEDLKPKSSPAKKKPEPAQIKNSTNVEEKPQEEPMATEVSTTTTTQAMEEEPKPESPRKERELQKKQTPEPVMFADKDLLVSSTPAKPSNDAVGLANLKKISKSTDNVTAISLSEVKTYPLDRSSCPSSYKNISGRRSLRPMRDYVFQNTGNSSLRESYRKINTELDVANVSNNTSLNVTVGSEVPNNWSFSFLGRSRKRDRTPTHLDTSEIGLMNDMDASPTSPKRPRFDFSGFVGILSSPVTMLRERLARTKIQNTPHKLRTSEEDIHDVANLSSVSFEEVEIPAAVDKEVQDGEIQIDVDIDALKEQDKEENKENTESGADQDQPSIGEDPLDTDEGETEVRETEPKKRGCVLM